MAATSQRLRGGILSVGSIGALVAGMAMIDETIRGFLAGILQGRLPNATFLNEITAPMLRAQRFAQVFSNSAGLSVGNQFLLVGFALGSVVLVVLMFRS
jgi:hypothetical protein